MPILSLFKPDPNKALAAALHAGLVAAARRPEFFGKGRLEDTFPGRLEALTLHAALLLDRLAAEPGADALSQAVTDRMFRGLDDALREIGVGDLSVGKVMKKMAGQIYGRFEAFGPPLKANDGPALQAAVQRNLFGAEAPSAEAYCAALSRYMLDARASLAAQPLAALGDLSGWPQFVAP
jgi:cytochrome b pre-mRNA-processing protein 3